MWLPGRTHEMVELMHSESNVRPNEVEVEQTTHKTAVAARIGKKRQ